MIDLLLDPGIENRAEVNAGGGALPTALHQAAKKGKLACVKQLISLGADANARGGQFNTALTAAAFSGYDEVVRYLLDEKADASLNGGDFPNVLGAALYSETYELIDQLIDAGAQINATDEQGRTSLHLAARRGAWYILEMFIKDHAGDPYVVDKQGRTLLHHAAMSGDLDTVRNVLERDHSPADLADVDGWTPLHWACRSNANLEIVQALVQCGASIEREARDGWTPENIAAFHGADEVHAYLWEEFEKNEKPPQRKSWKVGSGVSLVGFVYTCAVCQDFDFCFKYYRTADQTHRNHTFKCTPKQDGDRVVQKPEIVDR